MGSKKFMHNLCKHYGNHSVLFLSSAKILKLSSSSSLKRLPMRIATPLITFVNPLTFSPALLIRAGTLSRAIVFESTVKPNVLPSFRPGQLSCGILEKSGSIPNDLNCF